MDFFEILTQDHQKVSDLFQQIQTSQDETARKRLITQVKKELDLHAHIEETILYPALKEADETREITGEAYVEHSEVKQILAKLEQTSPTEARFNQLFTELRTNVEHHVKEEEGEMFPKARKVLGQEKIEQITAQIAAAKQQNTNTATAS